MVQVAPKLQQQQIVFATQPQDESRGDVETGGFFGTNLSSFVAYGSLEVCFVSIIQGKHSLREQKRQLVNVREEALQIVARDCVDIFHFTRVGENP